MLREIDNLVSSADPLQILEVKAQVPMNSEMILIFSSAGSVNYSITP